MRYLKKLPQELVENETFNHLLESDLIQVEKTYYTLHDFLTSVFICYNAEVEAFLNGEKGKLLYSYIKRIKFPKENSRGFNKFKKDLKFFKKNCPNVVSVTSDNSFDQWEWELLSETNWELEEVNVGTCDKNYIDNIMKFRESIRKIRLEGKLHQIKNITINDGTRSSPRKLENKLELFQALEDLDISVKSRYNIFEFENIIPKNIKTLKITMGEYESFSIWIPPKRGMKAFRRGGFSKVKPWEQLEKLELQTVFNSKSSIKYLIRKVKKLEFLKIKNEEYAFKVSDTISLSKKVRDSLVELLVNKTEEFEISDIYLYNLKDFLQALIEEPKSGEVHYSLTVMNKEEEESEEEEEKACDNRKLDICKSIENEITNYKITVCMSAAEALLNHCGFCLTELTLYQKVTDSTFNLGDILRSCSKLTKLTIHNADLISHTAYKKKQFKSIETLCLSGCLVHFELLPKLNWIFPKVESMSLDKLKFRREKASKRT